MKQQNDAAAALRQRKRIRQAVLKKQNDKSEDDDEENVGNNNRIPPSVTKKLLISSQHQTSSLLAKFYIGLAAVACIVFIIIFLIVTSSEENNSMSVGGIMRALGLWGRNNNHNQVTNEAERIELKIASVFPPQISYDRDVQELNKNMGLITKENTHVVKAIKRSIVLQNMLLGSNYKRRQRLKEKVDVTLNIFDEDKQITFLRDLGHQCMIPPSIVDDYEQMIKAPISHVHHTYLRNLWMLCILYSGYADGYIDHATSLLTEDEWVEQLVLNNHGKNIAVVIKDSKSLSLIQSQLGKHGADEMNDRYDVGKIDDTRDELNFIHPSLLILSPSRQHDNQASVAAKMIKFILENNAEDIDNDLTRLGSFYLERKLYELIVSEQQQYDLYRPESEGIEQDGIVEDGGWLLLEGKCFLTTETDNLEEIEYGNDGITQHDRLARHCASSAPGMFGKEYGGFCCDIMM